MAVIQARNREIRFFLLEAKNQSKKYKFIIAECARKIQQKNIHNLNMLIIESILKTYYCIRIHQGFYFNKIIFLTSEYFPAEIL